MYSYSCALQDIYFEFAMYMWVISLSSWYYLKWKFSEIQFSKTCRRLFVYTIFWILIYIASNKLLFKWSVFWNFNFLVYLICY